MKLSELKPGDKITHYCKGQLVEATVVLIGHGVKTTHKPVEFGHTQQSETYILPSLIARQSTTPIAYFGGKQITV
jgi:hypothetical protein